MNRFFFDGAKPKNVSFDSEKVKIVTFDGEIVWRADLNIFPEMRGTLANGKYGENISSGSAKISNDMLLLSCANTGADCYNGRSARTWIETDAVDLSDYTKLSITGNFTRPAYYTWGSVGVGISSSKIDFRKVSINNDSFGGVQGTIDGIFDLYANHTFSGEGTFDIDVSGMNGEAYIYLYAIGGYSARLPYAAATITDITLT